MWIMALRGEKWSHGSVLFTWLFIAARVWDSQMPIPDFTMQFERPQKKRRKKSIKKKRGGKHTQKGGGGGGAQRKLLFFHASHKQNV